MNVVWKSTGENHYDLLIDGVLVLRVYANYLDDGLKTLHFFSNDLDQIWDLDTMGEIK